MTALQQAFQVMGIGLPVMFAAILLFIGIIKLLFVIFPGDEESTNE